MVFGPVEEIRTNMIDGNMYLTVKVPGIQGLEPRFRIVNVAYYDTDAKKFHELAKISEAPAVVPQESQAAENQGARDYPAPRFDAPAASSSSSAPAPTTPPGCVAWQYRKPPPEPTKEQWDEYHAGRAELTTMQYEGVYEELHGCPSAVILTPKVCGKG